MSFLSSIKSAMGSLYRTGDGDKHYANVPEFDVSHDELLELADLSLLRSAGREIYGSMPMVAGAMHEKATNSVGQHWLPIYSGKDKEWGRAATAWLKEYLKVMDVRGMPHSFVNNHWVGSVTLDRDGEYFILPLNVNGFPRFQFIEGHRCDSRYGLAGGADVDRFPGLTFSNGRWVNAEGRPIFFRILGKTEKDDRIIPARNIIHVYDPRWFSQGRGVPSIVQGILDWKDTKKFRENTKTAANVFSSLTIVEKNATGKPNKAADYFQSKDSANSDGTEKKLLIEEYLKGSIRYIRANGKDDIQSFKYDTPPSEMTNFIDSIMRGGFAGMDWPFEQAIDMRGLGTAQVRAITNKVQRSVNRRQYTLNYPAARMLTFALALASKSGIIPKLPLDWYKWKFAMPPKMTADAYREASQDREDYKLGFVTLEEIYSKRGEWWVDHVDGRFSEEVYYDEKSEETGIDMGRVRMLTPNGNPVTVEQQEQDAADDSADDKDKKEKPKEKEKPKQRTTKK